MIKRVEVEFISKLNIHVTFAYDHCNPIVAYKVPRER